MCLVISLAWVAVVGAIALATWPHLPLDMSPVDPTTISAYRAAILKHVAGYAALALGVPGLVYAISRLIKRRSA